MKPDIIYRPGQRLKDNKPKPTASLADAKPVRAPVIVVADTETLLGAQTKYKDPGLKKTAMHMAEPKAVVRAGLKQMAKSYTEPVNRGGRPSTKGQVRIFIKEILKNLHANIPPHQTIKGLSEIERDILLEDLLLAHRKRQKAKAKAQKRWRVKVAAKP